MQRTSFSLRLLAAGSLPALAVTLTQTGCVPIGNCADDGSYASVTVTANASKGPAPLTASLTAHGKDGACACSPCEDEDREIQTYRWDLDDDGVVDWVGIDLNELDVTVAAPGTRKVRVTVRDGEDNSYSATIVLEATAG